MEYSWKEGQAIPTLWIISIVALWVLVLFETTLLVLLLRALGELKQGGAFSPHDVSQLIGLEVGVQAPSFVASSYNGDSVQLEDFRGRRCILAFVSPDCSACAGAIEAIHRVQQEEHDLALLVVGGSDARQNERYAHEHQAQMPIWTAPLSLAMEVYRVPGVPFVFVLDANGVIRAKGTANQEEQLQALLKTVFEPGAIFD
ncbi:MAG: peroxiredoxin family protein [Ktedonobacteraceae bacterium]